MKVLLVNGSPHLNGCTFTALNEIAKTLETEGVSAEIYNIGTSTIAPCKDCHACAKLGRCAIKDKVNEFLDLAKDFDGFVFGSPVHYGSASGALTTFLDRVFFVDFLAKKNIFAHKPATAVVSARRAGTTATLDQLNKYFTNSQMPIISGRYWNMVHGFTAEEAKRDLEGMQNMRVLAKNMAYFLKCKEAAAKAGITPPTLDEEIVQTHFIS